MIFDVRYIHFIEEIRHKLSEDTKLLIFDLENSNNLESITGKKIINLHSELETANRLNPALEEYTNLSLSDIVLMIYTSGTTGYPKAARINGYRVHFMGWGPSYLNRWSRGDIFYTALPLFHASGRDCRIITVSL